MYLNAELSKIYYGVSTIYSLPSLYCPTPPTEEFASYYYEVIRRLSGAAGCDAKLVIVPDIDKDQVGEYNNETNTITVALTPDPYDVIGTILHEVAHYATRQWSRPHGYRWRQSFTSLTEEFVGTSPCSLYRVARKRLWKETGIHQSRQLALDIAVVDLLSVVCSATDSE